MKVNKIANEINYLTEIMQQMELLGEGQMLWVDENAQGCALEISNENGCTVRRLTDYETKGNLLDQMEVIGRTLSLVKSKR